MADKKSKPKAKPKVKALPGDIPFSDRTPVKGAIPDHTNQDVNASDDSWDTWQPPIVEVNKDKKINSKYGGKK